MAEKEKIPSAGPLLATHLLFMIPMKHVPKSVRLAVQPSQTTSTSQNISCPGDLPSQQGNRNVCSVLRG